MGRRNAASPGYRREAAWRSQHGSPRLPEVGQGSALTAGAGWGALVGWGGALQREVKEESEKSLTSGCHILPPSIKECNSRFSKSQTVLSFDRIFI